MKVHKRATAMGYCCLYQCIFHTAAMSERELATGLDCNPRYVRQLRRELRAGTITCAELKACQSTGPAQSPETAPSAGQQ